MRKRKNVLAVKSRNGDEGIKKLKMRKYSLCSSHPIDMSHVYVTLILEYIL
jgi:hypothetical protein